MERNTTSLLAQIDRQEDRLLALPLDDRVLATIELPDADASHLSDNTNPSVVEVAVDRFPVAQFAARGHVARPLPLDAGPDGDRELLLTKAHLHQRPAAPRASAKAPSTKKRHDLTAQPALVLQSWSGAQAPCLPAVHVEPHDGGCRLWIHAPTVAERLNGGSSIDQWLQEQGEALCLSDTWQPRQQQPHASIKFSPGTTQEAISLRVDVDADGHLGEWEFQLSTVRRCLSDQRGDGGSRRSQTQGAYGSRSVEASQGHLGQLETLLFCARSLNKGFQQDGAIELDLPNPQVEPLAICAVRARMPVVING